jgi:hypothetical protein
MIAFNHYGGNIMTSLVIEKITKIDEKKKELETKKKLLVEKEKQKAARLKSKRFAIIGKMVSLASIDHLDDSTLLGAFLEIKKISDSQDKITFWKNSGDAFLAKEVTNGEAPLSISFNGEIGKNEKDIMKSIGFRFNKFRNEFYGYGNVESIKNKLNGFNHRVETLNS